MVIIFALKFEDNGEMEVELNRYQFEILAYIEEFGKKEYQWRELTDSVGISGSMIIKERDFLVNNGLLLKDGNNLVITNAGRKALEPFRVQRAVIFAAGFGSRMVPVTLDTPKPLVKINGIRIIDRLLDALIAKEITDITIVRGYLKEKFNVLLEKYPFLNLVDNDKYETENNISSALVAGDKVDRCYICAGDLLVSNPSVIKKYHYRSNYLASYALETDDWCFDFQNGFAKNYRKGGKQCFNQYEIAYWDAKDSARMREDWRKAYSADGGKELFWEFIPLVLCKDNYQVEIRQCNKSDIMEIDNFYELVEIDPIYKDYPGQRK